MIILILGCVLDGWRQGFAAKCCRLAQMSSNSKIPMMFKTHEVARKKHKPNVERTLSMDFITYIMLSRLISCTPLLTQCITRFDLVILREIVLNARDFL